MTKEDILNHLLMQVIVELVIIMRQKGLNPVGEYLLKKIDHFLPEDFGDEQVQNDYKCIIHAAKRCSELIQESEES